MRKGMFGNRKRNFRNRAFISGCIGCKASNTTLFKLVDDIVICKNCRDTLTREGKLTIHNGGTIGTIDGPNKLTYIAPPEKEVEEKETQ